MLKRPLIILTLVTAVLATGFLSVGDASFYSKMGRSMDAFGAVLREVSTTYVDEVDPQLLIEAGIEGMLDKLDPYTVYVPSEDKEDLELISSGIYTGFGITVASRDSILLITNVRENYPAAKAGIRIGDQLLSIAGVRVDTLSPKELRRHTRGKDGQEAELKFLREGRSDTITITIPRAEMIVENVAFSDVLPGDIGYIHLTRFSRYAPMEVRRHIGMLRERAALKGLILDLRDNPGGLLDAAVGIVETFVPRGSVIVSTRSRDANDTRTIRSENNPLEPSLPLAVLINERSASASEVVAGAIQDLDRGVVVGRRSYGKGLVQTVVPLPNDASLKVTTARYYTPSGRSIQRIDFAALRGSTSKHDTLLFNTRNGRVVRELHGIEPDTSVSDSLFPAALEYLLEEDVFFRFGTRYTATKSELPEKFTVDKTIIDQFVKYVESQPPSRKSPVLAELAASRKRAESFDLPPAVIKSIEAAEKSVDRDVPRLVRVHQDLVRVLLEGEIRSRFEGEAARTARAVRIDPSVGVASRILASSRYSGILGGQVGDDQ